MNIINSEVTHKTFGAGTVAKQENGFITVQFSEEVGNKRFQYPAAFGSFLSLSDPGLRDTVDGELQQLLEAERLAQQERDMESEKKREAEKAALQEAKRAAPKKKASAAKVKTPH